MRLADLLEVFRIGAHPGGHRGGDHAGRDAVASDAVRRHLDGHATGQAHDAVLGGHVGQPVRHRLDTGLRRDVDDGAGAVVLARVAAEGLACVERALDIDVHVEVPDAVIGVEDVAHAAHPGAVHNAVEPAEPGDAFGGHGVDLVLVRDIDTHGDGSARVEAEPVQRLLCGGLIEIDGDDIGAILDQPRDGRGADAAAGAGDDVGASFKLAHFGLLLGLGNPGARALRGRSASGGAARPCRAPRVSRPRSSRGRASRRYWRSAAR